MDEYEWESLHCENCGYTLAHHGRFVSMLQPLDDFGFAFALHRAYVWDACPMPVKDVFTICDAGVQLHIDLYD